MKAVELSVGPRIRDLVGFSINRVWPTARRRLIGPFVFYDHMRRCELPAGAGLDVPPHPHIGLATVTWLFEGSLLHRDSLGTEQLICPGDLNWMVAGRGITHSERSDAGARDSASVLHGTQAWVALPADQEFCDPGFIHLPRAQIPHTDGEGVALSLIAGSGFGLQSPVAGHSPMHYAEALLSPGATLSLPRSLGQRAAYLVAGSIECDGEPWSAGQLLVFADELDVVLRASDAAHVMLLGGAPLDQPVHLWWNFVGTTEQSLADAKTRWAAGEFPVVPGESAPMKMPAF